jgi:hypothetical protein
MTLKRLLILAHRYLGAALCLLFAVWFASGMVMVFVGFPAPDDDRRLNALPPLPGSTDRETALPSPAHAFARRAIGGRIRLGMLDGRPVYRFVDGAGSGDGAGAGLVDARDATVAVTPDADQIADLAATYLRTTSARARAWPAHDIDRGQRDQWTPMIPAAPQFPVRRFESGDEDGNQVYVSLPTAEVVQATTRRTRLWAWLGPIPHWIYPIALRRHAETWRLLVIALATAGGLLSLSGLVIGVWHWRPFRRWRPCGRATARAAIPYRATWMRWHHTVGLGFGCLVFTWVASGALSLNPARWSTGSRPSAAEELAFRGGPLQTSRFTLPPARALAACRREIQPRELELIQIGGHPYYLCRQSSRDTRLVAAEIAQAPQIHAIRALAVDAMLAAGTSLWAGRPLIDVSLLHGGDGYFEADAGLPGDDDSILRVRVADARGGVCVWYYLDRRTGRIVARLDRSGRLERWLYHGFHSLDFPFSQPGLRPHSAIWYVVIVGACALGLFFSVTGIAVTLGWLGRVRRRRL